MICTPVFDSTIGRVGVYETGSYPTGDDLYEGKVIYDPLTDRLYVWNGTSWSILGWSSAAGRVIASVSRAATQSIGTGATATITWDTEATDVDGFIAVPGTTLTVPSGLDMTYAIQARISASGGLSGGGTINVVAGGVSYPSFITANNSSGACSVTVPLAASAAVSVSVYNGHSGSLNFTGTLTVIGVAR